MGCCVQATSKTKHVVIKPNLETAASRKKYKQTRSTSAVEARISVMPIERTVPVKLKIKDKAHPKQSQSSSRV